MTADSLTRCVGMTFHPTRRFGLGFTQQCRFKGRYIHEGLRYCLVHHPPTVARRDIERTDRNIRRWQARARWKNEERVRKLSSTSP